MITSCNSTDRRPIKRWPIRSTTRVWYHQLTRYNSLWLWRLRTGCRNLNHCQQQSYSGRHSPGRLYSAYQWNDSWVQTFQQWHPILSTYIHRIHKWRTRGRKLVPNHENEALEDNKHKFLTDSISFSQLTERWFLLFITFRRTFFTVTGFLGCRQALKFTVLFPFATKRAA